MRQSSKLFGICDAHIGLSIGEEKNALFFIDFHTFIGFMNVINALNQSSANICTRFRFHNGDARTDVFFFKGSNKHIGKEGVGGVAKRDNSDFIIGTEKVQEEMERIFYVFKFIFVHHRSTYVNDTA